MPAMDGDWTTSFWINKGSNTYTTAILFGGHDSNSLVKLEQYSNTEKIGITTDGADYSFNYIIPENKWVHIALVGDSAETVLYVDGKKTDTINKGINCPLKYVGTDEKHKDRNPYNGNMVGSIDDLKLFDRVLTDEEILMLSGNFEAVSREELKAVIDEVKSFVKEDYTEKSWAVFAAALANAETVYADANTSAIDVTKAYNSLVEAKEALVEALEENHFNVASFNIAGGRHPNIPGISQIMEDLNITIAGIQEVDVNTGRNKYDMMQRFLDQGYFTSSHFRKAMDYDGGQYGNGILSLHELTNRGGEALPWMSGVEPRAYTRAEVEIEGKEVAMYSTHLNYENLEIRTEQIETLIEVLDNDPTEYKILTGDFNTNNSQEEFAPFLENYDIANGKDGHWINTIIDGSAGSGEVRCIDNIITTRNIQVNNVDAVDTGYSDHYMLYAECEFAEEADKADKTALKEAIDKAEALENKYTEDSWNFMQEALAKANEVYADKDASQEETDAETAALNDAMDKLIRVYVVTVNDEVKAKGVYNTEVSLTAPDKAGQTFAGWMIGDKVVSLDKTYTFFISNDVALTVAYDDVMKEEVPEAFLTNYFAALRTDGKTNATFVGQLVIPEGYTLKNAGLVWSSKADTALNLDGNLKPTYITKISDTNQFSVTIKGLPEGRFIRGRIFATVVDENNNESVIYSENEETIYAK